MVGSDQRWCSSVSSLGEAVMLSLGRSCICQIGPFTVIETSLLLVLDAMVNCCKISSVVCRVMQAHVRTANRCLQRV